MCLTWQVFSITCLYVQKLLLPPVQYRIGDAVVSALQLGFTDDIDPGLSLKLISQSMLAFFNRHLPLTEAQRSQFKQSQVAADYDTMPDKPDARKDGHLATSSQHMSSAEDQATDKGPETAKHIDQNGTAQDSGLQPGQVVLDGLSDGLSSGKAMTGRTYESRVKPEERAVFEDICKGHIAILDLSM